MGAGNPLRGALGDYNFHDNSSSFTGGCRGCRDCGEAAERCASGAEPIAGCCLLARWLCEAVEPVEHCSLDAENPLRGALGRLCGCREVVEAN